jgi:hypothetical protein
MLSTIFTTFLAFSGTALAVNQQPAEPARPLDVELGPLGIREDTSAARHGAWIYNSLIAYTADLLDDSKKSQRGTSHTGMYACLHYCLISS